MPISVQASFKPRSSMSFGILWLLLAFVCVIHSALGRRIAGDLSDPFIEDERECSVFHLASEVEIKREALIRKAFLGLKPQEALGIKRKGGTIGNQLFFITYGPPGSGKSIVLGSMMQELQAEVPGRVVQAPVRIIVDELVAAWQGYVEERALCRTVESSQKLYWAARKGVLGIDELTQRLQREAIDNGYNVVVETTGRIIEQSWCEQFLDTFVRADHGYYIALAYPLADVDTIIGRTISRERETGQDATPPGDVISAAAQAAANLRIIDNHIDSVYIYLNNGKAPTNLLHLDSSLGSHSDCERLQTWLQNDDYATAGDPQENVDRAIKAWVVDHFESIHDTRKGTACYSTNARAKHRYHTNASRD